MEDMMPRMSLLGVFVCNMIALQIELASGLEWMNISRNIVACEHDDIQLIWEYELIPGEYIKAKTWFTGENKMAKRIAYWKDTDGFKTELEYRDRVSVTGDGEDSLILRGVTTSDEGNYTLLVNIAFSWESDPRLALNLKIYVPPSQRKGSCKPVINATNDELHAVFNSEQGCGKPLPIMNWNISRNKMVRNDILIVGDNDRAGVYKVCLTGPAIASCFTGDEENLCASYTVQTPQLIEAKAPLQDGVWSVMTFILIVAVVAVALIYWLQKRLRTVQWDSNALDNLTKELVRIYREQTQFQKAERQIYLETEICDGFSNRESDMDITLYRNVFERNEQTLNRILIQGGKCSGKAAWCNRLTQEWRKAHDPDNEESNDNITFLKEYKLLFNISMSKVHTFVNLKDLLLPRHYSVLDKLNIDIYDYIRKHKTIIIIQGLDECTEDPSTVNEIVSDKCLEHAVVIISGTPLIWSTYSKGISVDRIIHVKGLLEDTIKRAKEILKDEGFPPDCMDPLLQSLE